MQSFSKCDERDHWCLLGRWSGVQQREICLFYFVCFVLCDKFCGLGIWLVHARSATEHRNCLYTRISILRPESCNLAITLPCVIPINIRRTHARKSKRTTSHCQGVSENRADMLTANMILRSRYAKRIVPFDRCYGCSRARQRRPSKLPNCNMRRPHGTPWGVPLSFFSTPPAQRESNLRCTSLDDTALKTRKPVNHFASKHVKRDILNRHCKSQSTVAGDHQHLSHVRGEGEFMVTERIGLLTRRGNVSER